MLTRSTRKMSHAAASMGVVFALLISMVGCGTLKLPAAFDGFTPVSKAEPETAPAEKSRGTFEVLMKTRFDKGSKSTQNLEGTVLLQEVLEASGAVKKFKGMEITIYRPVKGAAVPLQMQCDYDSDEDSVPEAENYEIYPGDRVFIQEVSSSKLGKLVSDLSPLER